MKIVFYLLIIVPWASAAQMADDSLASRSISGILEDFFKKFQQQMPCGFPKLGIPPLAPLEISHRDVSIDTPAFRAIGTFDDYSLHNLDFFNITEMKVNVIKSTVKYRLQFKNIYFDSRYDLILFLKKFGFTIDIIGAGKAKFEIKEFEIWGTVKYSLGIISNKLKLKAFDLRSRIGDVESNIDGVLGDGPLTLRWNKFLETVVPAIVNGNEHLISKTIEIKVLPIANEFLSKYRLDELVTLAVGGEGESIKCDPLNKNILD